MRLLFGSLGLATAALCFLLGQVVCFNLTVDESHKLISSSDQIEILWHADVPITVCQFRQTNNADLIDLSTTLSTGKYSYLGRGLEHGDCGVELNETLSKGSHFSLACRVRSRDGNWTYAMSVIDRVDETWRNFNVDAGPEMVLADLGGDAVVEISSLESLQSCAFILPGQSSWLYESGDSFAIDNSRLAQGKCRLTLFRVDENSSGFVRGQAKSENLIDGKRGTAIFMREIVVKSAPTKPVLKLVNSDAIFKEGDIIIASCHVGSARPVARITWLLGDDIIRQDDDNDDAGSGVWLWNHQLQTTSQTVNWTLRKTDDGKDLVCRVEHVALPGGWDEARLRVSMEAVPPVAEMFESPIAWIIFGVVLSVAIVAGVAAGIFFFCRSYQNHTLRQRGNTTSMVYDDVGFNLHDFGRNRGSHQYIGISEIITAAVVEKQQVLQKTKVSK